MSEQNYRAQAAELFGPSIKCIEGVLLKSGAAILEQMHVELAYRDAEIARLQSVLKKVIALLPADVEWQIKMALTDEVTVLAAPLQKGD